jgi:hypothetical protein
MSRYKLSQNFVEVPYPWPAELIWGANGVIKEGDSKYLLIKLITGVSSNAFPAPLLAFSVTKDGLIDVTNKLIPIATKFAITRDFIVADLNADGYDDFFLNNHGPEFSNGQHPGESNGIYLYQNTTNSFKEVLTSGLDFSHGSSIGDFNGDGQLDIYVNNLGATSKISSYLLKQSNGVFLKTNLSQSFLDKVGPLTTPLDIEKDGTYELASINTNGALVIWKNITANTPFISGSSTPLPTSEKGAFAIRSADFDANGKVDILVVGTGDEQKNSSGVVLGGLLKLALVLDVGLSTQRVLEPLKEAQINLMATGGIQVELIDLDKSGTIDFEIRTYDADWHWHRYSIFVDRNGKFEVKHNSENTIAINAAYIDANNDGVLDLVSDQYGKIRIQLGELIERYEGRAYDLDGNAGIAAKILGAVFGKDSISNKNYVGIGLHFLDAGWTYDNLAGLALDAAGAKTNDQIVSLLWTNVIGTNPTLADKQPFIALLENGMSAGALAHLAADTSFNTTNINLVGLAQTGIEYLPVS